MPMTPLPPPPQRNEPASFADKGDALLGALPTFVTQANALQSNVNAKEASAASSAASSAAAAAISEAAAAISEAAARVSAATASYKGLWTGLTGALNMPASVFHAGKFWALNVNLANVASAQPGVSGSWTLVQTGTDAYPYSDRATLRSLTPTAGDAAVVEGLGLFVFAAASTEPDDDESCFATASGRWLLEAAHWDLVDSWQAPDDQVIEDFQEDEPLRFASRFLTGSATCAITSVANVSSASFTGTVTGAATGDRVIATPPDQLGDTATSTAQLSYHAWVSAANTVTVMLTNASAAAANTNTAIRAAWPLTVIKP